MDNTPIFSNPQKQTNINWGNAGLIAGSIAAASITLVILIITYSASIIALKVLGAIATFSSLIGIVLSAIGIKQNTVKAIGGIALNIILVITISLVRSSYVSILPDQRGVLISAFEPTGYRSEALKPGLHWILPFLEFPQVYSVAPQTYVMASSSNQGDDSIQVRTKDGKILNISVSLTYSIDPAKVVKLHVTWQNRYEENVVRPVVRGVVREIASKYDAIEIKRSVGINMERVVTDELITRFSENDLILIHFEITDVLQAK